MKMTSDWYDMVSQDDYTDVYIYDVVGYETTAKEFVKELNQIENAIHLHLNTPGGDVFDGNTIHNALVQHPAPVHVYVDGLAASIGSVIAMAGDTINIAKNGAIMIHDPWVMSMGNADELRKQAKVLDKVRDALVTTYVDKTGQEAGQIMQWMNEETWFDADEALAAGFATEIIDNVGTQNHSDLSVYNKVPGRVAALYQAKVASDGTETKRTKEQALRDAGFTRVEAKTLLAGDSSNSQRDADSFNEVTSLIKDTF